MPTLKSFDPAQYASEFTQDDFQELSGPDRVFGASGEGIQSEGVAQIPGVTQEQGEQSQQDQPQGQQPQGDQTQPQGQQQAAPPPGVDFNNPQSTVPLTLRRTGPDGQVREYNNPTVEQLKVWAQLGLNASESGRELNQQRYTFQQERQSFAQEQEQSRQELAQYKAKEAQLAPLFKVDEAMQQNTPFREAVHAAWDQHVTGQGLDGGQQNPTLDYLRGQIKEELMREMEPHLGYIKTQEQLSQQREASEADRLLDTQFQALYKEYDYLDWYAPDPKHPQGLNLDQQVADAITRFNIPDAKQALWAIRGPELAARAEQAAMRRSSESFQQKHSQGVTLNGAPSKPGNQQPGNGLDLKKYRGTRGDLASLMASDPMLRDFIGDASL